MGKTLLWTVVAFVALLVAGRFLFSFGTRETSAPTATAPVPTAAPQLAAVREALADPAARLRAVGDLATFPDVDSVPLLFSVIDDKDDAVRSAACAAIRARWQAASLIRGYATDEKLPTARRVIAVQLLRDWDVESVPALLAMFDRAGQRGAPAMSAELRQSVVDAIASFGPAALPAIDRFAIRGEANSPTAEAAVAEILRKMGPPAGEPLIREILRWKIYPDVQELVIWLSVLGDVGDASALPALNRAAGQPNPTARAAANAAHVTIQKRVRDLPPLSPETGLLPAADRALATRPLRATPFAITPQEPTWTGVPADGVVHLRLEEALLPQNARPDAKAAAIDIDLFRSGGTWAKPSWGYGPRFNKREHPVEVAAFEATATTVKLSLRVTVLDDSWVRGGFAEYQVTLTPAAGQASGSFVGEMNGRAVKGTARATSWEVPARHSPSIAALASGEHPRLYFRPMDLPAMRARANTEFGQRVIEAIRQRLGAGKTEHQRRVDTVSTWQPGADMAIGHGLLAQLYDDQAHAQRGVLLLMDRVRHPPYIGEHGERLPEPLLHLPFAYDLLYGYLSPEDREMAYNSVFGYTGICTPYNGYMGVMAGGSPPGMVGNQGLMVLSIVREKSAFDLPPPPRAPTVITIEPEPGLVADAGIRVNTLHPGEPMLQWLRLGPLAATPDVDPLEGVDAGGLSPAPNEKVTIGKEVHAFVPFEGKPQQPPGISSSITSRVVQAVPLPAATGGTRTLLYGLMKVENSAECRLGRPYGVARAWTRLWINGTLIEHDARAVIRPGLHRVLMEVPGANAFPVFEPVDAAVARGRYKQYEYEQARYDAAKVRHAADGESARMDWYMDQTRRGGRLWAWYMIGAGVKDGREGKERFFKGGIWPFVAAHYVATGEGFSPDTPFPSADDFRQHAKELNSHSLCFLLAIAPGESKEILAREFDRRYGGDGLAKLGCIDLAAALAGYPLK